uniref:Uncharacterized protein n=1 Tax=Desertifilum tharense IPPAS B-1220 TaxID=1781255 RepID=A0ACD5GUM2_9CYAN
MGVGGWGRRELGIRSWGLGKKGVGSWEARVRFLRVLSGRKCKPL